MNNLIGAYCKLELEDWYSRLSQEEADVLRKDIIQLNAIMGAVETIDARWGHFADSPIPEENTDTSFSVVVQIAKVIREALTIKGCWGGRGWRVNGTFDVVEARKRLETASLLHYWLYGASANPAWDIAFAALDEVDRLCELAAESSSLSEGVLDTPKAEGGAT